MERRRASKLVDIRSPRYVGVGLVVIALVAAAVISFASSPPSEEVVHHLNAIADLAEASPMVLIPAGWFLMGTTRKDDDPYGLETQFDDTEQPQRRVWLDTYSIDRHEASLSEYLLYLRQQSRSAPEALERLIWHVISVHSLPDYVLARWPALYVTWEEAAAFCMVQGKRLPTEAEWEKAARGTEGSLFPWGWRSPSPGLAVFGQYPVHEIPLVAAVNGGEEGQSPYGLRHMAGNVAEWVQDWFGFDYYSVMPDRNPRGPSSGRYKAIRGGSWKSKPAMLRSATRNGAAPDQRAPTIGFRCAKAMQNAER